MIELIVLPVVASVIVAGTLVFARVQVNRREKRAFRALMADWDEQLDAARISRAEAFNS